MTQIIEFANQATILERIVARLISQIEVLQPETCFVSDLPTPIVWPPSSDLFVTVSPGEGEYDQGMFAAAGEQQVCERGSFIVAVFKSQQADSISAAQTVMLQPGEGSLAYWKLAILQALLKDAWEPSNNVGPLLRDALYPIRASKPEEIRQWGDDESGPRWSRMMMAFGITWDWDITGAAT